MDKLNHSLQIEGENGKTLVIDAYNGESEKVYFLFDGTKEDTHISESDVERIVKYLQLYLNRRNKSDWSDETKSLYGNCLRESLSNQ